jgi:ribosome biogenesis GTPase A
MPRAIAEEATIQWYPGHMARAMRRLAEDMRAIDIVVEVTDARVPLSGTNAALGNLAGNRPRLLVLSRAQLAEDGITEAWLGYYRNLGRAAIAVDAKDRSGAARLRAAVDALAADRRSARVIVLGIPNAGKSTAINALAGRNVARAEDRAGVTRARQWFRMNDRLEIMDTAGILAPKIDTPDAQWKLALVGAVPRARFDAEDIVARFTRWLREARPQSTIPDLETFAQSRGFVRRGTMVDTHNAAWAYLKDLGDGKFGKISLEEVKIGLVE